MLGRESDLKYILESIDDRKASMRKHRCVGILSYSIVCPGSSDPPEKIFNIFVSQNEVYTIDSLLRYFRLNIIRLQSKIIYGHMNSIG